MSQPASFPDLTAAEFQSAVLSASASFLPPGFQLDQDVWLRLHAHYRLLARWNRTVGLISKGSAESAPARHYGESLAGLNWTPFGSCLDLGSGAGFPGLILAACLPEQSFVLIEARERKAAFLRQAVATLSLANCEVLAEHWDGRGGLGTGGAIARRRPFAALLSRAVNLQSWLSSLDDLLAPTAVWLAWGRGSEPDRELGHWIEIDELRFGRRRRLSVYRRADS